MMERNTRNGAFLWNGYSCGQMGDVIRLDYTKIWKYGLQVIGAFS